MNLNINSTLTVETIDDRFLLRSILYYLEPTTEMADPLFRLGTYKGLLLPEIRALKAANPALTISMVMGQRLFEEITHLGLVDEGIVYIPIDIKDGPNPVDVYRSDGRAATLQSIKLDVSKRLHGIEPDLILAYENACHYLHDFFPTSIVLHVTFGAFSRAPFPTLAAFDPAGTFGHSFLAQYSEMIKAYIPTAQEREYLRLFRKKALQALSAYFPYKRELAALRQRYKKLVLFPCQVEGHYSVNGTYAGTHVQAIRELAGILPEDTALLVTDHSYRPAVGAEELSNLQAEHPNIVSFNNPHAVESISQFLVPFVDGVATISSSLGFQAALWAKPLLVLGHCHLASLADCSSAEQFAELLRQPKNFEFTNRDAALCFILSRYNAVYKFDVFKGENFERLLSEIYCSLKVDPTGVSYFFNRQIDLRTRWENLLTAFTEHVLKAQIGNKPIQPDHLALGIARHEVISFDLFDTIIDRPFAEPHDAFLLMEREIHKLPGLRRFPFARLRRLAEQEVRRVSRGAYEVTITEIYDRLAELAGLSDDLQDQIKSIEMDFELQICAVKNNIIPYLHLAEILSRGVVIASDFYIEREFIEKLLSRKGVRYDLLLVSATERKRKHNGLLYRHIIEFANARGASPNEILHIGDNQIADVEMAKANGLSAYLAPSALINLKRSFLGTKYLAPALGHRSAGSSLLLGMQASRFYSAPFNQIETDSAYAGSLFNIGYSTFGPLICGFAQWVRKQALLKNIHDIFFLSRDGFIVKQVFDVLYGADDKVQSHYLKTSRRALRVASLYDEEDLQELVHQNFASQPLRDFLENRFGFRLAARHIKRLRALRLRPENIVSPDYDAGKIQAAVKLLAKEMLTSAEAERAGYLKYLQDAGFIASAERGKVALVDIGYSASIQSGLEKLLPSIDAEGFYVLTHDIAQQDFNTARVHGYLGDFDDHLNSYRHALNDFVFLFETGFSSDEPSLVCMRAKDGSITGEYVEASNENDRIRLLRELHAGVVAFAADLKTRVGDYIDLVPFGPIVAESQLVRFARDPSPKDARPFIGCEVENAFGGGSTYLIHPPYGQGRVPNGEHLISKSSWKPGARAAYQEARQKVSPSPTASTRKTGASVSAPAQPKVAAGPQVTGRNRKLGKLARTPYLFFQDAKNPAVRPLKHLFGPHGLGTVNTRMLRGVLRPFN